MKIETISFCLLFLYSILFFGGCHHKANQNETFAAFFEFDSPIQQIGEDAEIEGTGTYQSVWFYHVDNHNNVYISNTSTLSVDKYDKEGKYLFSFGGKFHEAVKYPGWIERTAVDSKQNLIAYSSIKRALLIFSNNGQQFQTIDVNQHIKKMSVKKLAFDFLDNLYFLGYSKSEGYQLLKLDFKQDISKVIHFDKKRQRPSFKDLLPDFEFDEKSNIFVTDTIWYRVYKYSTDGRLLDTFGKEFKKNIIQEGDFNFFIRPGRIEKIPGYKSAWKKLNGNSRYFPSVFGINIDSNRIYIWTSKQDEEKKFFVDVYDQDFTYLCTTSYYNSLGYNIALIKDNKMFIPNIGSDSMDIKSNIGRFGVFNEPHRIDIFQVSERIMNDRFLEKK